MKTQNLFLAVAFSSTIGCNETAPQHVHANRAAVRQVIDAQTDPREIRDPEFLAIAYRILADLDGGISRRRD